MKTLWLLVIALVASVPLLGRTWKIDEPLRFHITCLEPDAQSVSQSSVSPEPFLKQIPVYAPDITNIQYSGIYNLGFPLPARKDAKDLKLFLKLYDFPSHLDAAFSARRIFDMFLLFGVTDGLQLYDFVKKRENVLLKFATIDRGNRAFTQKSPVRRPQFPAPALSEANRKVSPQEYFEEQVIFSSVYIRPEGLIAAENDNEQARKTAEAVRAFHKSLVELYDKTLARIDGAKKDNKIYFLSTRKCVNDSKSLCGLKVFEVPKEPLVFENYHDLPMPHDPKRMYLTGLLLVKLVDYGVVKATAANSTIVPGSKEFETAFKPNYAHMLEVGSVVTTSK